MAASADLTPQPDVLPGEVLSRIRDIAFEHLRLRRQLKAALKTGDIEAVIGLSREIVDLRQRIENLDAIDG